MKNVFILILLVAFPFLIKAQTAKNYVSSEYDRNSLTFVGLDYNENLSEPVINVLAKQKAPDKFYDNSIPENIIKTGVERDSALGFPVPATEQQLVKWLNDYKVGQQILSVWFNRQPDGSFNVDKLKERGLFNANDNDFMVASASKRGESSLMDMGLELVNRSYVLVFDYYGIMSMAQVYQKNETPVEKRNMNGFQGELQTFLIKFDFNELVAADFFQNYWTTPDDPAREAKAAAFEKAEFPFKFLKRQYTTAAATQFNPGQVLAPKVQKTDTELMDNMVKKSIESILTTVENQDQNFRVKAMVSDVKPIRAKIGKKEGLKFDQRYFVMENRTNGRGEITSKRVAVVKSMKVVDNRKVTSGQSQPSAFYKIAGGKVDNYGMFLQQKNDVGTNLYLGTTSGGLPGFEARLEYYISKAFGGANGGKFATAWKIYVGGGYSQEHYEIGTFEDDFTFARVSFGLAKDFYPLSFLHWGPFVGYGIEMGSWETGEEDELSTDFIEAGVRVGINLSHNIQLMGAATYYSMLSSEYIYGETGEKEEFDYDVAFEDRFGLGYNVGIRFMF
ncbi:MAG: hypothetical protein AB7S72_06185 [Draconibacterium sp.]